MSIKAIHLEALGFYIFHCFNIAKHISILVLFFVTFISCFVLFCWIFKNNCPIFLPQGSGFCTFFVPGGGEFPFQKNSPEICRQAWN